LKKVELHQFKKSVEKSVLINNRTAHLCWYIPFSLWVQPNVTICFFNLFIEASSNAFLNVSRVDLTANCSYCRPNDFL